MWEYRQSFVAITSFNGYCYICITYETISQAIWIEPLFKARNKVYTAIIYISVSRIQTKKTPFLFISYTVVNSCYYYINSISQYLWTNFTYYSHTYTTDIVVCIWSFLWLINRCYTFKSYYWYEFKSSSNKWKFVDLYTNFEIDLSWLGHWVNYLMRNGLKLLIK
jgi:hypothetical protein